MLQYIICDIHWLQFTVVDTNFSASNSSLYYEVQI